ncbi:hypothetical protein B7P33_08685 [Sediminicola luteus]|uniref:Uncharacterized protein n=1 Tax=Sediminicola luteus TaxID=319238 RepID=A0A2A4G871_9FLAO|nr:hypothetical protein [Sediminicola luteus]PCE64621.1 hypothetical protein B7P33_08685 [Sediminicola luteus]
MAIVVLFSTMSFTLEMHFCGDTLVDTAIFKAAKSCGMDMQVSTPDTDCNVEKKNCCSDRQLAIDGQDELKVSNASFTFFQQLFVTSFVYSYRLLFVDEVTNQTPYREYKPPLVVKDIYKLDETYLI